MDRDKLRTVLNTLFMIGALSSIILYFALEDRHPFFYVCAASLFLKMMEIILRIMR